MTTTNMFLNFGGKWDSPPLGKVVLENKPWRSLDKFIMKKMTTDLESKGKNTGYIHDLHGQ